jgi:hypothetical protein
MVNYIAVENPSKDLLIKFPDDMTLNVPVKSNLPDSSLKEVVNIVNWSKDNGMVLNLGKTWEMERQNKKTTSESSTIN